MSPPQATSAREHSAFLACILAWLVPGAGHWYLQRRHHALLFFLVIVGIFVTGISLRGNLNLFFLENPPDAQSAAISFGLTVVQVFNGVLYFGAVLLGFREGEITASTYEIGWAYAVTAALLNILVIFDAFDVAKKRK